MEYLRRETMQSDSAPETTAFTMRTIQEILAETGNEDVLIQKSAPANAAPAPEPAPQQAIQAPPSPEQLALLAATEQAQRATEQANAATAAAEHATRAAAATVARAEEKEVSRSLTSRLSARLFGSK